MISTLGLRPMEEQVDALTADDVDSLDNLVWHALTSTHARFASGDDLARRYPADVTVFVGLRRDDPSAWRSLATIAEPGETLIVFRAGEVDPPKGWRRTGGGVGNQMVLLTPPRPPLATAIHGIVELGSRDVAKMLELIDVAQPGPFRTRTIELGRYFGVFEEGALVAMAGERLQTPRFVEISAVSTHPTARGRGLASALTAHVARVAFARGQTPILHVAQSNAGAQRVYERLGFVVRRPVTFAAVERAPEP